MDKDEMISVLKKQIDLNQSVMDRMGKLIEKLSYELYLTIPEEKREHCGTTYDTFGAINIRALIKKCRFWKDNMQIHSEIDYDVVGVYKDDNGNSVTFDLPKPVQQKLIEHISDELSEYLYDDKTERGA